MDNILEDMGKAMVAISEYQSPINIMRLEFHSANKDNKIAWLDKFSAKTEYDYKTWYNVGLSLLGLGIVPELHVLNQFNRIAMDYELTPDELIKTAKGELIGR